MYVKFSMCIVIYGWQCTHVISFYGVFHVFYIMSLKHKIYFSRFYDVRIKRIMKTRHVFVKHGCPSATTKSKYGKIICPTFLPHPIPRGMECQ